MSDILKQHLNEPNETYCCNTFLIRRPAFVARIPEEMMKSVLMQKDKKKQYLQGQVDKKIVFFYGKAMQFLLI